MLIDEIGIEGQKCISQARVFITGADGLGSTVLFYLAAAGAIGIVDYDRVDVTNLQRQIIHNTDDVCRLNSLKSASHLIIKPSAQCT
ncbi:MAG: ThiF family adenylyltransferase [Cytophagaceae bacterium]|nr:ThiF family adenylyltransferase [Cytophagaceae bacterium]